MKPKPLVELNHFTVPVAILKPFQIISVIAAVMRRVSLSILKGKFVQGTQDTCNNKSQTSNIDRLEIGIGGSNVNVRPSCGRPAPQAARLSSPAASNMRSRLRKQIMPLSCAMMPSE